jgi:hypothetical protein
MINMDHTVLMSLFGGREGVSGEVERKSREERVIGKGEREWWEEGWEERVRGRVRAEGKGMNRHGRE